MGVCWIHWSYVRVILLKLLTSPTTSQAAMFSIVCRCHITVCMLNTVCMLIPVCMLITDPKALHQSSLPEPLNITFQQVQILIFSIQSI